MQFENEKKYSTYAKVEGINASDRFCNLSVVFTDMSAGNIKIMQGDLNRVKMQRVYLFDFIAVDNNGRMQLNATDVKEIIDVAGSDEINDIYKIFYAHAPVDMELIKKKIFEKINSIKNETIHHLVKEIMNHYEKKFFIYPAAIKFHHAYIGGLAYHTSSMLDLCDNFIHIYPNLSKDLLYAGVILHDIEKVNEFTEAQAVEHSLEGQLLGHLVMGAITIDRFAVKLNIQDKEEVLILKHMLVSHHGQANYGACKRPITSEATLLWYLDTLDSKLRVLSEELDKTQAGEFTDSIGVLDKLKFYKHNF